MNMHPSQLETLVRARTDALFLEAQQERLAQAATEGRRRFDLRRLVRRPFFAPAARPQLASQAGC